MIGRVGGIVPVGQGVGLTSTPVGRGVLLGRGVHVRVGVLVGVRVLVGVTVPVGVAVVGKGVKV